MALDQSALLEVLDALKAADVDDRIRTAAQTIYQPALPIAEVSGSRKAPLTWENACVQASIQQPSSGGLSMAKATRLIRPRTVTGDGEGLVSHAGLVWLGEVADRSGPTVGFSQVLASAPRRRHDPGVTLEQLAIVSTVTVTFKKQGGATRL